MKKLRQSIAWGLVAGQSIHFFCCALPLLLSVLSVLVGVGMVVSLPGFIEKLHHMIHDYEGGIILVSGGILVLGWGLYTYAQRLDCRMDGDCAHQSCAPTKDRTRLFMVMATILFVVNIAVYLIFHDHVGHEHDHHHSDSVESAPHTTPVHTHSHSHHDHP